MHGLLNRRVLAVFGLTVLFPISAMGQEADRQLSLDEAIRIAQRTSPDFLTTRNQLSSASWATRAAYGSLLPTVSASNSLGYTAGGERRFDSVVLDQQPAIYSSRYSLGMSLQLNGTTLLGPSVARARERATEQQVEGAAAALAAEVTQRYLTVLQSREAVDQAEREVARTEEHLRLAQARLDVGAGIQLDVSRAQVDRGQAEVRLIQAINQAENDLLLLGQVMGVRLGESTELTSTFELFAPTWDVEALADMAAAENPDVQAARAQASAARTASRAARSAYLPTISFQAGLSGYISEAGDVDPLVNQELQRAGAIYQQCVNQNEIRDAIGLGLSTCTDPTTPAVVSAIRDEVIAANRGFPFNYISQPASASVTVSLPIFTGLARQQQVEEARVARLNAEYAASREQLRVQVAVESALRDLQTAYQTALLQQQIRENAELELELAEERFRLGLATSIEVVDAQASLADAERAEIAAIYDFHRAIATLETTVGQPLPR